MTPKRLNRIGSVVIALMAVTATGFAQKAVTAERQTQPSAPSAIQTEARQLSPVAGEASKTTGPAHFPSCSMDWVRTNGKSGIKLKVAAPGVKWFYPPQPWPMNEREAWRMCKQWLKSRTK